MFSRLVAVAVVIDIPGTFLCARSLLGRAAQSDGVLRKVAVLLSQRLVLRLTSSRLRCWVDLVRVATAAG
jgi:hypothetical protein